jgi:hypothetical protein
VFAFPIIKAFNVVEDGLPGLISALVFVLVNQFCFQGFEKAFGNCVVKTVPFVVSTGIKFPKITGLIFPV